MEESPQVPSIKPKKGKRAKWFVVLFILLLIAIIAILGWHLKKCLDEEKKLENDKKQLQTQVDDLKKQLEEKAKTSQTDTKKDSPPACDGTVSQSLKDNIKDAVQSKNYAALEGYMTNPVKVVLAASEKGEPVTPTQAVADLAYLNSATSPWNFSLSAATLNSYKAGFYSQYFADGTYAGKAANDYVVSFGFDSCAKINMIFMAVNDDLLL